MENNKKRRLSQNHSGSANKLRFDSINKILKIDSIKGKKHKKEILSKQVSRVALSDILKNNSNGQIKDIPDFKTFLSDKDNIAVFRDFLKTQFCHENIDFYLACEKYRNLNVDRVGKEFVKFMANQIYNDYLSNTANQPININYDCLQNIISNIKNPDTNLLNDAQTEIYNLMMTDCYPRFCKTWQIDRDVADKILCKRLVDSGPQIKNHNNSTMLSSSIANCDTTTLSASSSNYHRSLNSLGVQRIPLSHQAYTPTSSISTNSTNRITNNNLQNNNNFHCPKECPYFSLGLPCENHQAKSKKSSLKYDQDLVDKIDIRRMHHVPSVHKRKRTPPPPPLPPKPMNRAPISPVLDKKLCPYVGKVFNV